MEIAIPPFDRFTARDVRGPYEQVEKVAPA